MSLLLPQRTSRRRLLQWSGLSSAGLLLNGCASSLFAEQVGQLSEPLNQSVEALMLSQKAVPEFAANAIDPAEKLIINSFDFVPHLDPTQF
ncbi:MAG TPA: hypothetical protein V6C98_14985, partial [Thermosynechococcaceae cyanobacterium]